MYEVSLYEQLFLLPYSTGTTIVCR